MEKRPETGKFSYLAAFLGSPYVRLRRCRPKVLEKCINTVYVPVAQLDRALDSDSKGRTFKSCQARHESPKNTTFSGLSYFL